jgi:hypothetical protein
VDPINTVIVGEAVAGRSHTVRKQLASLAGNITTRTFDLADLFYEAQANAYYLEWGFASLGEYASGELGIKERKAQYLARIVKVCRDVGVERKNYEPAGISKLREIATLDPDGFFYDKEKGQNFPLDELIVDLILDAPDMTLQQVRDRVDLFKGQTGENKQVVRSYGVTQDCWDRVIKPAIELARRRLGSAGRDEAGNATEYSDGACMEIICASFSQDPNNYEDEPDESGEQANETDGISSNDSPDAAMGER